VHFKIGNQLVEAHSPDGKYLDATRFTNSGPKLVGSFG
tara:strand:- start:1060 stop:1173 length:114 start_codon:yes stop_codon:yes gene_type:complete